MDWLVLGESGLVWGKIQGCYTVLNSGVINWSLMPATSAQLSVFGRCQVIMARHRILCWEGKESWNRFCR